MSETAPTERGFTLMRTFEAPRELVFQGVDQARAHAVVLQSVGCNADRADRGRPSRRRSMAREDGDQ